MADLDRRGHKHTSASSTSVPISNLPVPFVPSTTETLSNSESFQSLIDDLDSEEFQYIAINQSPFWLL